MRGFISLSFTGYIILILGFGILILGILLKLQTARLDDCKEEHEIFIVRMKAAAQEQEARTKAAIDLAQKDKDRSDANHKRTITRLERDVKRLRDSTRTSVVPPAAPGSPSPERACFDRPELDRALRGFIDGTSRIAEEGAEAVVGLDTAKEWAQ